MIINNTQPARIENTLLVLSLALFPLLFLTLKGWMNTFTVVMSIIAIVCFIRLPRSEWSVKNMSTAEWAVVAALSSGFLAILCSQLLRQNVVFKPYDGPLRMLLSAPVFLWLLRKKIDFIQIFQYVCPLSLLILLVFVQLYPLPINVLWGERFGTYFVDPNTIGIYTMLLSFLCLFSIDAVSKDGLALRLFKYAGVLAGLYLEIKSQTRGAWIAEPVLLALWITVNWQKKSKKELLSSFLISVLVILGLYFFVDVFHDRINSAFSGVTSWINKTDTETSVGLRISFWQMSWLLFKQSPLYGYGDLGYQAQLMMPQIQAEFSQYAIHSFGEIGSHNEYLANMVRSGIFGLIAVLLQFCVPGVIFIRGLKSSEQRIKGASAMGLCLVIGLMITGLSLEVLTLKYTNSFYGLMIAALCASVLWQGSAEQEGLK